MLKSTPPRMTDFPRAVTAMKTTVLLSVILGLSLSSVSSAHACQGYGKYRVNEYGGTQWNPDSRDEPARGLSAVGDFDGDGHVDEAFFVKTDDRFFLVVCRDKGARLVKLVELNHALYRDKDTGDDSVWALPPGIYLSSCAKGTSCMSDDPYELELAHEGIQLFYGKSAARIYYWANGRFKVLFNGS